MDKQHEIELARALLNGNTGAFEEFVHHFRAKIFQYSWLMCGHREDGEEVAQETLLRVFESLSQLREPERVRPWVYRIARNACLMKRRKSVFAPEHEISLDAPSPDQDSSGKSHAFEISDCSNVPDHEFLQAELRSTLHRAISELPENYRAVVVMRDLEELSTEETAQILDLSVDVVKQRLHRGRVALREKLNHYLYAEAVP